MSTSALPPGAETAKTVLPLFAGTGIELEYMIVDAHSLSVKPMADELIRAVTGAYDASVETGELGWSNELALHVIELKTKGPATTFTGLPQQVQREVRRINEVLRPMGACLMPTAMHPWMNPLTETRLWPHEYNPVYEAFNRVFGCQGHGWSNLQSQHLNLPFADDAEFAKLHAAIRLILPLLPALAASSPILDGQPTACLDNRLRVYRTNCAKIPSITGRVIPEPVFSQCEYEELILRPIYRELAPFDTDGTLQEEWVNARGAIARFERNTIEIRVLDVQECPRSDVAIATVILAIIRALVEERWTDLSSQKSLSTEGLEAIFMDTIHNADTTVIANADYLRVLGLEKAQSCSVGEVWQHMVSTLLPDTKPEFKYWLEPLLIILQHGCLARRILKATGRQPSHARLHEVYRELCRCLADNQVFIH